MLTVLRRGGIVILAVLFLAAAGMAIAVRGPWYDEFYSYYLVRPGASFAMAAPAWLRDNHPPLFYVLAWLWARVLGGFGLAGSVEALRTVNLAVLAGAAVLFAQMARADKWFARLAWYDLLALVAVFPALDRIDQLRSYFLSFVLCALVLPLLLRPLRRPVALGMLLVLAFSVHLITTVIVAGMVAAMVAQLLLTRRWHDALRLALIATVALIPFVLCMVVQLPTILGNTRSFWIPPGFNGARWAIEAEVLGALTANPLLGLVALAGAGVLVLQLWRRDTRVTQPWLDLATLGSGLTLALVVLLAAHIHRPLLISRYLVAVDPVLALMLAICAEQLTRRLPQRATVVIDLALLTAAGLAIHANYAATVRQWSWNGNARTISAIVAQCPATVVHADLHWNGEPLGMPPRDNRQVVPFAYAYMAQSNHFALAPAGSRQLSPVCPTLFWSDHAAAFHPTATQVIHELREAGFPVKSGRMVRHDIGWILITPRASPAPPPAGARHGQSG